MGILSKLNIRPTDEDAIDTITYQTEGKTYSIPRTRERFVNYFAQEFLEESQNIKRYVNALYALSEEVDMFYLRKGNDFIMGHSDEFIMPADEFIAKHIKTPRLRSLLAYMSPMYGGVAGHTPAYIHALINVLYIEGSSQFEGGSQQLADALCEVIEQNQGRIIPADAVRKVIIENRTIEKVVTDKGREYTADWYISDVHPCCLLRLTGDNAFPKAYQNRLKAIPNSCSCFSVFIKFKPESEPYVNHPRYYLLDDHSVWHFTDYDESTWPTGFMCITPPSQQQGKWASRMIVNCIMSFDTFRKWEDTTIGHRGPEYEVWKEKLKNKVLNKLGEINPSLLDHIDFCFASSPLTIRDYYGTKDGAIYGFQHDCKNIMLSQIPIATKAKKLLLTGQNVNLHGICGVPLTAIEVTESLVGKGAVLDKINNMNHYCPVKVGKSVFEIVET